MDSADDGGAASHAACPTLQNHRTTLATTFQRETSSKAYYESEIAETGAQASLPRFLLPPTAVCLIILG